MRSCFPLFFSFFSVIVFYSMSFTVPVPIRTTERNRLHIDACICNCPWTVQHKYDHSSAFRTVYLDIPYRHWSTCVRARYYCSFEMFRSVVTTITYIINGHPPDPTGISLSWIRRIGSALKFTSPNTTSSLSLNSLTMAFQAGACFFHQPHLGLAIHRTYTVFPWSTLVLMKSSTFVFVSCVE